VNHYGQIFVPRPRCHVLSLSMRVASPLADESSAYERESFYHSAGNNFRPGFFGFLHLYWCYPASIPRSSPCAAYGQSNPITLHFTRCKELGPPARCQALSAHTDTCWASLCCETWNMDAEGNNRCSAVSTCRTCSHVLPRPIRPWMRVEAVEKQLFSSADKSADGGRSKKLARDLKRLEHSLSYRHPKS